MINSNLPNDSALLSSGKIPSCCNSRIASFLLGLEYLCKDPSIPKWKVEWNAFAALRFAFANWSLSAVNSPSSVANCDFKTSFCACSNCNFSLIWCQFYWISKTM